MIKSQRKPIAVLALTLTAAIMIMVWPLSSVAARQAVDGTPHFLPVVLKGAPDTPTRTATATATATVTPTPTGTPITSTIPITVGPVINSIENFVYSPVSVTVHVGDVVRWTWGSGPHTVTSGVYPSADNNFCSPDNTNCSGAVTSSQGATFDHTFMIKGTFTYFCEIHGGFGMQGTVVVQ